MNIKCMTPILAALLLANTGMALGADTTISGGIDLGGQFAHRFNNAKLMEYRDLRGNVLGNVDLNVDKGSYYMDLLTKDMGLDTQSYSLKGGSYSNFKYSLFYNEIPHNYSFGARTYLDGIGTGVLRRKLDPSTTNQSLWNVFDYGIKRQNYGANLEFSFDSPFYISGGVTEIKTKGTRPIGISGQYDAPEPVDYRDRTINLEAGYRTKDVKFSIDGTLSKFENEIPFLDAQGSTGAPAINNTYTLAPSSDYKRIGTQLVFKLPLQSTFAVKGSYAEISNQVQPLPNVLDQSQVFNGQIDYTTLSAAITSNPVKPLDLKLAYNYLKKNNKSTHFADFARIGDTGYPTEVFNYEKNNVSLEAGYKLPFKTKVQAGYEYLNVHRSRADATETTDHIVFLQAKNSYLDMLSAKIRWQHLDRSSDFQTQPDSDPGTVDPFRQSLRRFDATDKTQDSVKVGLELTPIHNLDLGLEYAYKINNYTRTTFGRTHDNRHEILVDAAYSIPDMVKLTAYFDYEKTVTSSEHRTVAIEDPLGRDFNWSQSIKNENYAYGVGVVVPIIKKKLDLAANWDYSVDNGKADFSATGATALINIPNYDDATKKSLTTSAVFHFNKNIDLTGAYSYVKYNYDDITTQNYPANYNFSGNSYLSGAYKDQNYEASIVSLLASYKF